jgi:heptosyltransferase-2
VAVHGPTDPALSGPWPPGRAVVVRLELPCSPCYDLTDAAICPLGHHNCLRLLGPGAVVAAAEEALRAVR